MDSRAVATEGKPVSIKTPKLTLDITVLMGGPSSEHDVADKRSGNRRRLGGIGA